MNKKILALSFGALSLCAPLQGMHFVRGFVSRASQWATRAKLGGRARNFNKMMSGAAGVLVIGAGLSSAASYRKSDRDLLERPKVCKEVYDSVIETLKRQGVNENELKNLIVHNHSGQSYAANKKCMFVPEKKILQMTQALAAGDTSKELKQVLAANSGCIAHEWGHIKNRDVYESNVIDPLLPASIYYSLQGGIRSLLRYIGKPAFLRHGAVNAVGGILKFPLVVGALVGASYAEQAIGRCHEDRADAYALSVLSESEKKDALSILNEECQAELRRLKQYGIDVNRYENEKSYREMYRLMLIVGRNRLVIPLPVSIPLFNPHGKASNSLVNGIREKIERTKKEDALECKKGGGDCECL